MNPGLYYVLAVLLVGGGLVCWLSNLFSLPGNWALVGLAAAFAYFVPVTETYGMTWKTIVILVALAGIGELVEFAAGAMGAAKHGASRRSILYSLMGAIVGSIGGAIAGLPIPIVGSMVAALLGGSAGAFAGAYVGESLERRPHGANVAVAKGAFFGRLWGTLGKFALGAVMVGLVAVDALIL